MRQERFYKVLDAGWMGNFSSLAGPTEFISIVCDSIIEADLFHTFRKKYPATNTEKSMTSYCDVKQLLDMNVLVDVTTQVKRENKLNELYDNNK